MQPLRHLFCVIGLLSFLFVGCDKQAAPQSKPPTKTISPDEISYSQVDITESFGDHLRLKTDDWIATIPINKSVPNGKGLPPVNASADEVYTAAAKLSRIRESLSLPSDGVYCPVCHIANTQLMKLRTPCPKCGRPLLKFGWD